jgi:hypothetical protein
MLQLSLTTQTLLLSLSSQSSTFCQCFTLSSVLTLCSSLALTLTSPTVSLIMFCLLSRLSSLILSSVPLLRTGSLASHTGEGWGGEGKETKQGSGQPHRTRTATYLAQARNRNRFLFFLTGLFLYSHILIQIPVISSPVSG